jgi:hypothetical protein
MKKLWLFLMLNSACFMFKPIEAPTPQRADYCIIERDKEGNIKRSTSQVRKFKNKTGYPKGRRGWVVDHVLPLCACGADSTWNMQWQTVEDAKIKDKWERKQCGRSWKRGIDG